METDERQNVEKINCGVKKKMRRGRQRDIVKNDK